MLQERFKEMKQTVEELEQALNDMTVKYKLLESFVEEELGIKTNEMVGCASPVNYCSNCSCGKKERFESATSSDT